MNFKQSNHLIYALRSTSTPEYITMYIYMQWCTCNRDRQYCYVPLHNPVYTVFTITCLEIKIYQPVYDVIVPHYKYSPLWVTSESWEGLQLYKLPQMSLHRSCLDFGFYFLALTVLIRSRFASTIFAKITSS
jgi:hypothetical protein